MKTPEEFREHFAKESKYLNWNEMWMDSNETIQLENDIMQSYADYVTSEKDKEIERAHEAISIEASQNERYQKQIERLENSTPLKTREI